MWDADRIGKASRRTLRFRRAVNASPLVGISPWYASRPRLPTILTFASALSPDPVLLAAQAGDAEAFATLYDAHAPRLFAVCVGLLADREAATELVQDTFVRAWRGLRSFRADCSFATWLHRIAVNEMLNTNRRDRRRSLRVLIQADLQDDNPDLAGASDGARTTNDIALGIDLEHAIARLPHGARAVFVLYDIGGYGHAEISAQLGIAEGTSKAHLFRARRLLRTMLDR